MWAVSAHVETVRIGHGATQWHGTVDVPTFYLDERVQGIMTSHHAENVARQIIDPLNTIPRDRLHISTVKVS